MAKTLSRMRSNQVRSLSVRLKFKLCLQDDDDEEDETDGMIVPHGYLSSDEEQHDENGN